MKLRAGMLGLGLLAALAARAGEPGAPLEKSKEELRALQKDSHTPAGEATLGKLRDAMPQMQSPGTATPPVESTLRRNSETEMQKKKAAQKNWLLDGMDKLEKHGRTTSGDAKGRLAEGKDDNEEPEAGDPDYVLKLYSEQQKKDEARNADKQAPAVRSDPFAPFLQGWLADSPVHGKFFDEYLRKPDAAVAGNGTAPAMLESPSGPGLLGMENGTLGSRPEPAGGGAAPKNPYLQGLDLSLLQDSSPPNRPAAVQPAFQPAGNPLAGSLAEPAVAPKPPEKRQQLPAVSDDKKYFPQLKKF